MKMKLLKIFWLSKYGQIRRGQLVQFGNYQS